MKKTRKKFAEALARNNLTAYKLGKILGVGIPTVYYWLWGESVPKVDTMLKLTKILHISAQEVLEMFAEGGEDE